MGESMSESEKSYLFVGADLGSVGTFTSTQLDGFSERHRFEMADTPAATPVENLKRDVVGASGIEGTVFALNTGIPSRRIMRISRQVLATGRKVYYWWPQEGALEVVDRDRLRSFWKHWIAYMIATRIARLRSGVDRVGRRPAKYLVRRVLSLASRQHTHDSELKLERIRRDALDATKKVYTIPFVGGERVTGSAVYLRTDFWAPLNSGGSYGHTCYFAKALKQRCDQLVCLMANRFALLDDLGIRQIVVTPDFNTSSELDCILANTYYYDALKPVLDYIQPAFIYERLCLGNYAGARLSQELGIPYFVEYNGSELSMKRSFEGRGHMYEDFFLEAERLAFDQATVISVVSERVREDLLKRGVDGDKILVSWNAVDLEAYVPADDNERAAVREELGIGDQDRVVCFTGTFGGWHGIDVLTAAIPRICRASTQAKFLLIGDGVFKADVHEKIQQHALQQRVIDCGRVAQKGAARLMAAADIFVSPHSRNMVDSPFFGSPTKLFEYMAYGRGIVASELEQLADILDPAFRMAELGAAGQPTITDQQALLCAPGDVDEFVAAVVKLVENPELAAALGRNARADVENKHTWTHRVESLWNHLADANAPVKARAG
jgi:glycosyltransferase involved in cell wall biosynthesis